MTCLLRHTPRLCTCSLYYCVHPSPTVQLEYTKLHCARAHCITVYILSPTVQLEYTKLQLAIGCIDCYCYLYALSSPASLEGLASETPCWTSFSMSMFSAHAITYHLITGAWTGLISQCRHKYVEMAGWRHWLTKYREHIPQH